MLPVRQKLMIIQMRHDIRTHYMIQMFAGKLGDSCKQETCQPFSTGDKCLLKIILWGFHPSLLTVEKDVQILDLARCQFLKDSGMKLIRA